MRENSLLFALALLIFGFPGCKEKEKEEDRCLATIPGINAGAVESLDSRIVTKAGRIVGGGAPNGDLRFVAPDAMFANDNDNSDYQAGVEHIAHVLPIGCTGWMISRNHMLTAGHCFFDQGAEITDQIIDPTSTCQEGASCAFFDELESGNFPITGPDNFLVRAIVANLYNRNGDYVLLELAQAADDSGIMRSAGDVWGWFDLDANPPLLARLYIAGFGAITLDFPNSIFNGTVMNIDSSTNCALVDTCRLDFVNRNVFEHTCDSGRGNSGSPIVDFNTGRAIGVHDGRNPFVDSNYGTTISSIVNRLDNNDNGIIDAIEDDL